jgi:hypothetical protein
MGESQLNGWEEGLGSEDDVEEKRPNYSVMEAEIRRLTAELRALKEAKIDQEATQLAREHGFLSPYGSKIPNKLFASTPVSKQFPVRASPNVLNASAILDDDVNFSFEDWASPVKDSPTSRLLRTPLRPKPYFVSTVPATQTQSCFPESLLPDPDLVESTLEPTSPPQIQSPLTPDTPNELASSLRTPMRAVPVTPKNGPFGYEEPQPRVLTRIVYIPRSSHWCEHICQILFLLMVIFLSIAAGVILVDSGHLEALQGPPPIYLS